MALNMDDETERTFNDFDMTDGSKSKREKEIPDKVPFWIAIIIGSIINIILLFILPLSFAIIGGIIAGYIAGSTRQGVFAGFVSGLFSGIGIIILFFMGTGTTFLVFMKTFELFTGIGPTVIICIISLAFGVLYSIVGAFGGGIGGLVADLTH